MGAKAQYAYDRGFTGKDVTIAIIDSGIDLNGAEFAGRISQDSKSFESRFARCGHCTGETITYPLQDVQGHGTWVASVAAGAKNDIGSHGVAYDATILALKIAAPWLEDLAPGAVPEEGGPNAGLIAPALKYAMDHGAFVANISINGTLRGDDAIQLREAMDLVRANNGLLVQSVSNESGDSFAGSFTEILVGENFENKDWFLYGIRVDPLLRPIPGNGQPGALADRTLAVVADRVLVVGPDGEERYVGGNSFAAPAIAGAAALLKQYWPQLGGKEISEILLTTATDLGEPGVDQIYGAGLLNIEAAFKADAPQIGTNSATMSAVENSALIVSSAFGGADGNAQFSSAAGTAVAIDKWGRDYQLNVGALVGEMRSGGISIAGIADTRRPNMLTPSELAQGGASFAATEAHNINQRPTGHFAFRVGEKTALSGSVNESIDSSDLISGSMLNSSGLATFGSTVSLAHDGHRLSFGVAQSDIAGAESETYRMTMQMPNGLLLGFATSQERGSALGMRGVGAFQIEGAKSNFVTVGWTGEVAGFNLTGEAMAGRTDIETRNALIEFNDAVLSTGFRLKAEREALGGNMVFGLTSPLKVERATLSYTAPYMYDLETRSLVNRTTLIDLTPSARELNVELGWAKPLGQGRVSLNGAYGFNSGNSRGQNSTAAWLRYAAAF